MPQKPRPVGESDSAKFPQPPLKIFLTKTRHHAGNICGLQATVCLCLPHFGLVPVLHIGLVPVPHIGCKPIPTQNSSFKNQLIQGQWEGMNRESGRIWIKVGKGAGGRNIGLLGALLCKQI